MLAWMILTAVICVLLGIILTLVVEWHLFSQPTRKLQGDDDIDPLLNGDKSIPLELPPELVTELGKLAERAAAGNSGNNEDSPSSPLSDETLLAVNLLVQFFFRELRSQGKVRRFLLNRINHEMEEILTKGAVSKIIKGLKIYDIEMGTRAPSIQQIRVHSVRMDDEKKEIESLNFDLDVDYSGGIGIAIDCFLAYSKSAFLSAKVEHLKGQVRLIFSRRPYSHWSLAFSSPPQLKVEVTSRVQGRSFSHVTSLISAQIHKWIQRKHTLPTARMRHKPFFPSPDFLLLPPPRQSLSSVTKSLKGSLEVTVIQISRLNSSLQAEGSLCCTMALDSCSWINTCSSELEGHVILDIRVVHKRHQRLGIQFHPPSSSDSTPIDENKSIAESKDGAVIMEVETGTPAEEAGLRIGDLVLQVDEVVIRSAEDVARAAKKTKEQYLVIRVDRYISRKRGSTFRLEGLTPSATLDGLYDKSPLASPSEEMGSSLLLPLGSHLETPSKSAHSHGLEVKRTMSHPLDKVVHFGDKVTFQVIPGQRFLNLTVLLTAISSLDDVVASNMNKASLSASPSKTLVAKSNLSNLFKKHSPLHHSPTAVDLNKEVKEASIGQKETRPIGHVNISLPEVAADCQLNTQGHHINTYQLYPADIKASSNRQNLPQPGFEPRLCYGDIILSFVYRPDKKNDPSSPPTPEPDDSPDAPSPPALPPIELAQPAIEMVINESPSKRQSHDYILTHFAVHSQLCDFCRKKIWLREALQCRSCGCVCHKKCIKRYPDRELCNSNIAIETSSITVDVPRVEIAVENNNPFFITNDEDELAELESAVERLMLMEHDEMLIRKAKDSGKELHSHLENGQRRLKITSMLQRLEAATEAETIRRYELAAFLEKPDGQMLLSADERKEMEKEAASCESRRQALVLLLLHYSAGLRSAEEAEEASECDESLLH